MLRWAAVLYDAHWKALRLSNQICRQEATSPANPPASREGNELNGTAYKYIKKLCIYSVLHFLIFRHPTNRNVPFFFFAISMCLQILLPGHFRLFNYTGDLVIDLFFEGLVGEFDYVFTSGLFKNFGHVFNVHLAILQLL